METMKSMNTTNTNIILMGFYSLAPDSSSGTYNEEIARIMKADIESLWSK